MMIINIFRSLFAQSYCTIKRKIFYLGILIFVYMSVSASGKITPGSLRCEYLDNPTVVDALSPRLSWINEVNSSRDRGLSQQAYRIVVSTSKEKLQKENYDAWDSGKQMSSESRLISYNGNQLQSGQNYWWRVMVWDNQGKASSWSSPAFWGMGLLNTDEWKAQWIGTPWQGEAPIKVLSPDQYEQRHYAAPLFRKTFKLKDNVVSAKAFVTGLGYFEFYMNGKKVGDDYLVPNFTDYTVRDDIKNYGISIDNKFRDYRVMYLAYDITNMLKGTENVAGAILGNGFYDCSTSWVCPFGSPRFLCQIEVTYADHSKELICTDDTWKVTESPIVLDGVFDGEVYDANKEIKDWGSTEYNDSDWSNATYRKAPEGKLTANTSPTDKITEVLKPTSLKKLEDGTYEVEFAKEISGWLHFKDIQGNKGDTLNVKYICESPLGVYKYIFKGTGKESYAPRFTWYVFSKAIISGVKNLSVKNITAEAVNTDVKLNAEFKTSNELFNKINQIWQQSQTDNMHGCIASDCPHRERSPYTGDGQVACTTVMYNFDAAAFYQKWIRDIRNAQNVETGYVPNGAPWQPGCGGGVPWGAAMNIMPWEFYLHYGDRKMIADNYYAMKEQVRYMLTWLTPDGTMLAQRANLNSTQPNYWLNLGDWAPAFSIPSEELVHTFYLWRCADFTAKAARVMNLQSDADYYASIAEKVKRAFNKKFYNPQLKSYGDFGSNVYALVLGVPSDRYNDVVATLKNEISVKYNNHLNTGIFGTQFLFETLAQNGLNDIAYAAMNQEDFPSFGNWIKQGATVTWEQWDGRDSHNHPMFGGGLTWFYRILAGVNVDINQPGFKHIIIKPILNKQLPEVYYSSVTPYGKVVSEIKQSGNNLEMNVTVPVGSTATIHIPIKNVDSAVTENNAPIKDSDIVKFSEIKDGYYVVTVPQGNYKFKIEN
ncbi:MAG: alpha-L-rhamnosidase N-terminal domain-containing protein [Paludibacter sp.]|nr:alpha-L-rhamnosidase N-terminal domain-containing protein [Paludibacter sp.]